VKKLKVLTLFKRGYSSQGGSLSSGRSVSSEDITQRHSVATVGMAIKWVRIIMLQGSGRAAVCAV
jgi:hypothetical protein